MSDGDRRKAQKRAWYNRNSERLKLQRDLDLTAEEAERLIEVLRQKGG